VSEVRDILSQVQRYALIAQWFCDRSLHLIKLVGLLSVPIVIGCQSGTQCQVDAPVSSPIERFKAGQNLAKTGNYEGALAEYAWCLDCGLAMDPTFVGVHHTALLRAIRKLATEYPAALDMLQRRQAQLESKIVGSTANDEDVTLFVAINKALDEQARSAQAYAKLVQGHSPSELRAALWNWVIEYLFERKGFDAIAKETPTTMLVVSSGAAKISLERHRTRPDSPPPRVLRVAAMQYRSLLETGSGEEATAFANDIFTLGKLAETFGLLLQQAREARNDEAVAFLLREARARLSDEEYGELERPAGVKPPRR